jgi:hypothetical protein
MILKDHSTVFSSFVFLFNDVYIECKTKINKERIMPSVKIKLNNRQLDIIKQAHRKGLPHVTITIRYEDLLGDKDTATVVANQALIKEMTDAFNEERRATIKIPKQRYANLIEFYDRLWGTSGEGMDSDDDDSMASYEEPELTTTSEVDLANYAKKLGLPNFTTASVDEDFSNIAIINSTPRAQGGIHWTAAYITPQTNFLFDPYGLAPDLRIVDRVKSKNENLIKYNTLQVQGTTESNCGQQCIRWLYEIHNSDKKRGTMRKYCTEKKEPIEQWWSKKGLPKNGV